MAEGFPMPVKAQGQHAPVCDTPLQYQIAAYAML